MNRTSSENGRDEILTRIVSTVWADVLKVDAVADEDDFRSLGGDLGSATQISILLNQLLRVSLLPRQVLRCRTPRRLAETLGSADPVVPGTVPAHTGPPHPSGSRWRDYWDSAYRFADAAQREQPSAVGWFDKRTLTPLPELDMDEWREATASRVSSLRAKSILDIGCGNGLLLAQLAPGTRRYVATDFSRQAVRHVERIAACRQDLVHVSAFTADAIETLDSVDEKFDLILLNSVVQYFPDLSYLERVLQHARRRCLPGGHVFVGDVRNQDVHRAAHVAISTSGMPDDMPVQEVRHAVMQSISADSPLLLAPDEWRTSIGACQSGTTCRLLVRRGTRSTEMNRFRYDVVISSRPEPALRCETELHWPSEQVPDSVLSFLAAALEKAPSSLVVRGLPDRRTRSAVLLARALDAAPADARLGPLRKEIRTGPTEDPEEVWRFGHSRGYGVAVAPSRMAGRVDVALCRERDDWSAADMLSW